MTLETYVGIAEIKQILSFSIEVKFLEETLGFPSAYSIHTTKMWRRSDLPAIVAAYSEFMLNAANLAAGKFGAEPRSNSERPVRPPSSLISTTDLNERLDIGLKLSARYIEDVLKISPTEVLGNAILWEEHDVARVATSLAEFVCKKAGVSPQLIKDAPNHRTIKMTNDQWLLARMSLERLTMDGVKKAMTNFGLSTAEWSALAMLLNTLSQIDRTAEL